MKQLFLLFVFITGIASIKAQNTKPTKAETMQWMADKIKATLINNVTRFTYENGVLFVYYEKEAFCGRAVKLDLNAVTNIDTGVRNAGNQTYYTDEKAERNGDLVSIYRLVLKGNKVSTLYWKCGANWEEKNENDYNALSIAKKSYANPKAEGIADIFLIEGLYDRMIKAAKTLIEYNTKSKSGEVF